MHVGLCGKVDWSEDTKIRLVLVADSKTNQRQQTSTALCASSCEGDVL